jgi:sugar lactone lactonase YvrE
MAKRVSLAFAMVVFACVLYLLAWPVPVAPVAWDAPQNHGLVDPFEANDRLQAVTTFDLGQNVSPEDITGRDGWIYSSTLHGRIIRLRPDGSSLQVFAETGGRPLGIAFDDHGSLIVANAQLGLQSIAPDGQVSTILSEWPTGSRVYPNNVDVTGNGKIYFSEPTRKFGGSKFADSYDASVLAIVEHGGDGRVLEFDPATGVVREILSGLTYANGVALSNDEQFLLVNETAEYRIWRCWLEGPRSGQSEVILDSLPGFPDNISAGVNDRFWVGLVAPRNSLIDKLSNQPWARKILLRLPRSIRPAAEPSTHLIAIDGNGTVLMNLQDSRAGYAAITGAYETRNALYLSSLFGNRLARLDKAALAVP